MGVDPCDEESISIVLDVLNVWSWWLLSTSIFLENFEISHLNLEFLSIGSPLISNVVIHFLYKLYS